MSFYDLFKNLFGITGNRQPNNSDGDGDRADYRSQFLNPNNEHSDNLERSELDDTESDNMPRFSVYTDPIEMHKYFEEQINEVLKTFTGVFGPEGGRSIFGFNMPSSDLPQIEPPPETNLREHLLKPGYHSTKDNNYTADSDVDGKVNVSDLDMLLKNRSSNDRSLLQPREYLAPQVKTFGQSITSKTIRGPDGSIETHRSVRDNAGNEETTITRQMGDKQYTVTIRTDKHGVQEKVEDMKNIDEKELSRFTDNWQHLQSPQIDINAQLNNWFENIFK